MAGENETMMIGAFGLGFALLSLLLVLLIIARVIRTKPIESSSNTSSNRYNGYFDTLDVTNVDTDMFKLTGGSDGQVLMNGTDGFSSWETLKEPYNAEISMIAQENVVKGDRLYLQQQTGSVYPAWTKYPGKVITATIEGNEVETVGIGPLTASTTVETGTFDIAYSYVPSGADLRSYNVATGASSPPVTLPPQLVYMSDVTPILDLLSTDVVLIGTASNHSAPRMVQVCTAGSTTVLRGTAFDIGEDGTSDDRNFNRVKMHTGTTGVVAFVSDGAIFLKVIARNNYNLSVPGNRVRASEVQGSTVGLESVVELGGFEDLLFFQNNLSYRVTPFTYGSAGNVNVYNDGSIVLPGPCRKWHSINTDEAVGVCRVPRGDGVQHVLVILRKIAGAGNPEIEIVSQTVIGSRTFDASSGFCHFRFAGADRSRSTMVFGTDHAVYTATGHYVHGTLKISQVDAIVRGPNASDNRVSGAITSSHSYKAYAFVNKVNASTNNLVTIDVRTDPARYVNGGLVAVAQASAPARTPVAGRFLNASRLVANPSPHEFGSTRPVTIAPGVRCVAVGPTEAVEYM